MTRLSLSRIQSAAMVKGLPPNSSPPCNGLIWTIDISIALGTGKILAVLALDANHHQHVSSAPGLQDVRCIAVSVSASWTGEAIAAFLKRLIDLMGRPTAYLKDGGSDLRKAVRLLDEQGLASPSIDDISHTVAKLLKRRYQDHPTFETFISACGRVSGKLKQTILACLTPPKVQTKARFMNVHRLIIWADKLLKLSPPGSAAKGSALTKLRACLDRLPACKDFIKRFREDAAPMLTCQEILKTRGLSYDTLVKCAPHIETIRSPSVRHDFSSYLKGQLEIAIKLGLDEVGMTISSDQIESVFGLSKQHGAGEIKDAGRIAIRIPALCGTPTKAEAEQSLKITVAEQQEIINCFPSLTKQRREVLSNPDRIETLRTAEQAHTHIELIPSAKNRSKNLEIVHLSTCYGGNSGPGVKP